MTPPIADASIYADFAGLQALKKAAHDHDPGAVRKVAQAFESLFARMLIKSMRDAIGSDPIFGGSQMHAYQQMYDDQLSMEITKGHGLGLADMLVRQLQHRGAPSAAKTDSEPVTTPITASAAKPSTEPKPGVSKPVASASPPVSETQRKAFVHTLWPQACRAARELGVAPQSLLAQAALETHWGCALPERSSGASSHNLFGVKADGGWAGASVSASTHEVVGGVSRSTTASFRAYANATQSFENYVSMLRHNPRFSGALGTGRDVQAFASALQRGGYATDPNYASKVTAIAHEVAGIAATAGPPLKLASAPPIFSGANPAS